MSNRTNPHKPVPHGDRLQKYVESPISYIQKPTNGHMSLGERSTYDYIYKSNQNSSRDEEGIPHEHSSIQGMFQFCSNPRDCTGH